MPLTSRFQNLVSTADSQWGPVPCYVKKKMVVKSSQVSDVMSKFRIVTMKINSVVLSSQMFRRECDQQRTVLLGYWWLHETFLQSQIVPVQVYNQNCCVVLSRSRGSSQPDDHGQMISEKWTSSRQEIRSRAAVTGDVMAADVSPPPADAALPVQLQVRPQDVDRGHGLWIIVVVMMKL